MAGTAEICLFHSISTDEFYYGNRVWATEREGVRQQYNNICEKRKLYFRASDRFYLRNYWGRTWIYWMLYCNYFIIVNYCPMYYNRIKSAGSCRTDHLRGGSRTDRNTEFYQHQCGNRNFSEHRYFIAFCKLWTFFHSQPVQRNRGCIKCRITTEKIPIGE